MKKVIFIFSLLVIGIYSDCGQHCISCSDDETHECYQCEDYFDFNAAHQCVKVQCPEGTYLQPYRQCDTACSSSQRTNEDAKTCEFCHDYNCVRCDEQASKCQECKHNYIPAAPPEQGCVPHCQEQGHFFYYDNCLESCPEGTRANETGICDHCDYGCLSCENKIEECLTCFKNFTLNNDHCEPHCETEEEPFFLYGNCYGECPPGFGNHPDNHTCQNCFVLNCGNCTENLETCSGCHSNFYLDSTQGTCEQCSDNFCDECNPENPQQCHNCMENYNLTDIHTCRYDCKDLFNLDNQCLFDCPDGSYVADEEHKICHFCEIPLCTCSQEEPGVCSGCVLGYTLNSAGECEKCPDNQFGIAGGQCAEHCPEGFFANRDYMVCQACYDMNCHSCEGSIYQCDACNQTYEAIGASCVPICSQECQSHQCLNEDREHCFVCAKDRYLTENGSCADDCPPPLIKSQFFPLRCALDCAGTLDHCAICDQSDGQYCNECHDGSKHYNFGFCVEECPEHAASPLGYDQYCFDECAEHIIESAKHITDLHNCDFCSEEGICHQCSEGFFLVPNGRCVQHCPQETLEDHERRVCDGAFCDHLPGCAHCANDHCLACNYDHFFDQPSGQCVKECIAPLVAEPRLGQCVDDHSHDTHLYMQKRIKNLAQN